MTRAALLLSAFCLLASCADVAPPYASCGGSDDCGAGADACYRVAFTRSDGSAADGRFCSRSCSSDTDCAAGGVCLSLAGDGSGTAICYAPCSVSADCYAGLRCTPTTGAAAGSVCMP